MIVTIAKQFDFDAAHRLPALPLDHKCSRLHGHTYRVEIRCAGTPDEETGMVLDYADIATAWERLHLILDHRYLNEIDGLETPTTEILAGWIARKLHDSLPSLVSLRVYESSTTWCEIIIRARTAHGYVTVLDS